MNQNLNFFRFAELKDIDEINALVRKNEKWFTHLDSNHFLSKINKKECIYENGVLITFKNVKHKCSLGTYEVMPGNVILEQLIKNTDKSNSNFVKHVFIKFLNCVLGSVYLAVNSKNIRAIKFYEKMKMDKVAKVILDYKDSNSLYVEGYVYKSKKANLRYTTF